MKRIVSLIIALLIMLTGLSVLAETVDETPLTIKYLSARSENQSFIKVLNEIVALYQQKHPNFKMEIENIPDRTSYLQKLKILAASDELPDWFDSDPESFFASLVDAGYVYDMDKLFGELGYADRFFDISKEYARLNDGRLYLFTWQCNAEYFFYNKSIFAAAGIDKMPATMDELLADCEKIKAAGYTPIAMGGAAAWPILRYFAMVPFRMAGNEYIENACAGKASFGTEAGLAGAAFLQKIASYFQEGWTTADYDTQTNLFTGGQAAMLYDGTWALENFVDENKELKDEFGLFTMPAVGEKDATTAMDYFANSGLGTAVLEKSMNDQMKDFMAFFFEHYPDMLLKDYSTVPSLMPSDTTGLPKIFTRIMEDANAVRKYAKCWDVVIDSASLETLNSETMNLALGLVTPEEWAATMDTTVAQNLK